MSSPVWWIRWTSSSVINTGMGASCPLPIRRAMAFVRSTNKMDAIKAYLNTWLKDETMYCNYCGVDYMPHIVDTGEGTYNQLCCENPQIGRNIDHTKGLIKQNQELTKNLDKETGAMKNGAMRIGLSLPPRLYTDLKKYFEGYDEKFLDTPQELHAFMREFKQFTIPRSI